MWRDQYEELLNTMHASSQEKLDILEHFKSISSHVGMQVTMLEVLQIDKDLPNAKSSGLDGLNGESLKYAHPLLCLLLSIGFTFFFLKEDFITKSTKHNTKNYNYLQNMYKPTTKKISNTVHHKQDIMKR